MLIKLCKKTGKGIYCFATTRSQIEAAGFTNAHEKSQKCPIGDWAKNSVLREAGKVQQMRFLSGMKGYPIFLSTKFGEQQSWTPEEVQVYPQDVRNEVNGSGYHAYNKFHRIWAQNPLDADPAVKKPEVQVEKCCRVDAVSK